MREVIVSCQTDLLHIKAKIDKSTLSSVDKYILRARVVLVLYLSNDKIYINYKNTILKFMLNIISHL